MSKRKFGAIKSLLHFDFPYFNEPNDGLGDEVGMETWSRENGNVKLYGSAIPNEGTHAPKFGYRCLHPYTGGAVGTNTTGIWNLNSSKDYEIECFIFGTSTGTRHLLRLYNSQSITTLTVSITENREITVLCPNWGIDNIVVSTGSFTDSTWQHILLRITGGTLKVYIEGAEVLNYVLTPDVTLSVSQVKLGYSNTASALFIDEFAFRHAVRSKNFTIPTEPYTGILNTFKVGGFGDGSNGDVTITANSNVNSCGLVHSVIDTRSFTFSSIYWGGNALRPATGVEILLHITAPRTSTNNAYPLVGLYAFAKIASLTDNSIVLDHDISLEEGYDFTLDTSLLTTYYVQFITVPNYKSLTLPAGKAISAHTWDTSVGGGIVAFRCTDDCTIEGNILTHGMGAIRRDYQQMTNSRLVDRFLCSQGGGIFIACGGTLTASSAARLGASWSGLGDGSNGATGYGGNGGYLGGSGGVGGGGGGGTKAESTIIYGGNCGSKGNDHPYRGTGGGGCGGNGGNATASSKRRIGGSGGGGQANTAGIAGTGSTANGIAGQGINGGDSKSYTYTSSSTTVYVNGGGGAGGPGGNGGIGRHTKTSYAGGIAGASILLICKDLNVDTQALSTGGGAGTNPGGDFVGSGSGGGGTGFTYIACERML